MKKHTSLMAALLALVIALIALPLAACGEEDAQTTVRYL